MLEDQSVSRRHAEVVFLPDGRLHLADCATTNGTFVLDDNRWRPLQQAILRPLERIRLGKYAMTAGELGAWCKRSDGEARDSNDVSGSGPTTRETR